MAPHSSVLAWRIPGTGEPGGLLSMGSRRVGHDWSDLAAAAVHQSELYSILCNGLYGEENVKRVDTCVTDSIYCTPETHTTS